VIYSFNPYFSIDTHGYYRHFKTKTYKGTMYGPELDFVVRGANPTIFTPLVGVGVGYDRWARQYQGDMFDDAGSATAVAFVGAQINLTKHFGIQGMRKQKIYLADAPVSFDDRQTEEPKSQIVNSFGFVLVF